MGTVVLGHGKVFGRLEILKHETAKAHKRGHGECYVIKPIIRALSVRFEARVYDQPCHTEQKCRANLELRSIAEEHQGCPEDEFVEKVDDVEVENWKNKGARERSQ